MSPTGYRLRPRHVGSMALMTAAALAALPQQASSAATGTSDALIRPQPARSDAGGLDAYRIFVLQRSRDHLEHEGHLAHLEHEARLAHLEYEARERPYALQHVRRHIFPVLTSQPARQAPAEAPSGASGSPQAYAESLVGPAQFACLEPLWERESGWNASAENPGSGAYGIPQSLPGDKMASAGSDWQTDADTQIRWGIQYLDDTYGSACGGWAHEQEYGWY